MATRAKSTSKVSSAAFQRAFGRYRELALQAPVSITSHGRESLVLLSVTEYRRLKDLDRRAMHPSQLSAESIAAIKAAEPPPEAAAYDHEYKPTRRRRR